MNWTTSGCPSWKTHSLTAVRRRSWPGLVILCVLLASCATASAVRTPSGDPGGRVLTQLRPVRAAIPKHNVIINYANYEEPKMDSCDGQPGTQGWDEAVVQVSFRWKGKVAPLMSFAAAQMAENRWVVTRPEVTYPQPYIGWSKHLLNGTTATSSLDFEDYGTWTLIAEAPPVGKPVTGC